MTITLTGPGLEIFKMFLSHSTIDPDGMAKYLWYHGEEQVNYFLNGVLSLQLAVKAAGYDVAEFSSSLKSKIEEYASLLGIENEVA